LEDGVRHPCHSRLPGNIRYPLQTVSRFATQSLMQVTVGFPDERTTLTADSNCVRHVFTSVASVPSSRVVSGAMDGIFLLPVLLVLPPPARI
jgi:hypothetical protein